MMSSNRFKLHKTKMCSKSSGEYSWLGNNRASERTAPHNIYKRGMMITGRSPSDVFDKEQSSMFRQQMMQQRK